MVYNVAVDASGPIRVIQNMQYQLRALPGQIKEEFLDWQSEDMHRSHPHSKRKSYKQKRYRISTMIYPRGRKRQRPGQKPQSKKARRARRRWSTRPILRAAPRESLTERMTSLFQTVGWAASGSNSPGDVGAE